MFGTFGSKQFGSSWYTPTGGPTPGAGKVISLVGDSSSHGGVITNSGQDGTLLVGGVPVAVNGALHVCPLPYHGSTPITAITTKSFQNGKLILTHGAIAGCGATIISVGRPVFVE